MPVFWETCLAHSSSLSILFLFTIISYSNPLTILVKLSKEV